MAKWQDLRGKKYGYLTPFEYIGRGRWKCLCVCSNIIVASTSTLNEGKSKSCGCRKSEFLAKARTIHEKAGTRVYSIWASMKSRCYNPHNNRYHAYGARGIIVCEEWKSDFASFYKYMGEPPTRKHSIDRIDVNGNYELGNVRWASTQEQSNNKRNSRKIEYHGETKTLTQWAKCLGINHAMLNRRLELGWSVEDAFKKESIIPTRKLNDTQIQEILDSKLPQKILAKKYSVSASLIGKIKHGIEGYKEFHKPALQTAVTALRMYRELERRG